MKKELKIERKKRKQHLERRSKAACGSRRAGGWKRFGEQTPLYREPVCGEVHLLELRGHGPPLRCGGAVVLPSIPSVDVVGAIAELLVQYLEVLTASSYSADDGRWLNDVVAFPIEDLVPVEAMRGQLRGTVPASTPPAVSRGLSRLRSPLPRAGFLLRRHPPLPQSGAPGFSIAAAHAHKAGSRSSSGSDPSVPRWWRPGAAAGTRAPPRGTRHEWCIDVFSEDIGEEGGP